MYLFVGCHDIQQDEIRQNDNQLIDDDHIDNQLIDDQHIDNQQNNTRINIEFSYAESSIFITPSIIMLGVITPGIIMLNVAAPFL
jgi:hypothetical protein